METETLDAIADAIALVTAVQAGDAEAQSIVLSHADTAAVARILARLAVRIVSEASRNPEHVLSAWQAGVRVLLRDGD